MFVPVPTRMSSAGALAAFPVRKPLASWQRAQTPDAFQHRR
ncbi:hypothetical protein [Patulibacter sp. SYSU D01012]|nr:hypothetical protein [Patulibacter sp. SYSU D01012]